MKLDFLKTATFIAILTEKLNNTMALHKFWKLTSRFRNNFYSCHESLCLL